MGLLGEVSMYGSEGEGLQHHYDLFLSLDQGCWPLDWGCLMQYHYQTRVISWISLHLDLSDYPDQPNLHCQLEEP